LLNVDKIRNKHKVLFMFSETDTDDSFTLTDEETTYQLLLRKNKSPRDDFFVTLRIPAGKARAVVTGRSGYAVFRNGEKVGPETKIVEVGAGLSGFLPDHVAENAIAPENTPVVIDPIDYEQCGQLLTEAEGRSRETGAVLHPARRRIRTLLQRCNVYRGDSIQTISMTLADAVERHPELAEHEGKIVEGIMFVHRSNAKPDNPGGGKGGGNGNGGGGGGDAASSCYSHLAKGAKWKMAEDWILDPANAYGLTDSFLLSTTGAAFDEWEAAASADIVGAGSLSAPGTLVADESSPDGLNEIYFGSIDEPNVIAVTITWGIFGGKQGNRELVEMDQVYDQVDFSWNNNGDPADMDYENIAQHEIGHGLGMGHTPTTTDCVNETMYPTASNGETSKRDLGAGDIAGMAKLYK